MHALAPVPLCLDLALSASALELAWIAGLCDAGDDAGRHFAQLQRLQQQAGQFSDDQVCYPYEVIERGASRLRPGHPREFVICVLLWLQALAQGRISSLDPQQYLDEHAMAIEALPDSLRDVLVDAFLAAGY